MVLPIPILRKKVPEGTRIAFVGKMGVGKTFCAQHLISEYGYYKFSLAAKLKAIAYEMYGTTGKDGNDRLILQGLGSDLRKYDPDVWVKYLLQQIHYAENGKHHVTKVAVDDVRYLNEEKLLRKNGFILIRVTASPNVVSGRLAQLYPNRPPEADSHASETEQEGIVADYSLVSDNVNVLMDLDNLIKTFND